MSPSTQERAPPGQNTLLHQGSRRPDLGPLVAVFFVSSTSFSPLNHLPGPQGAAELGGGGPAGGKAPKSSEPDSPCLSFKPGKAPGLAAPGWGHLRN